MAKKFFRINKTMEKMAKSEANRSQAAQLAQPS
jgi:hypothetical protein